MALSEQTITTLRNIKQYWLDMSEGNCSEISEDIVDQCGGMLLQFCHKDCGVTEFLEDVYAYGRCLPIYDIYTPYNGTWTYDFLFHQVAVIDGMIIDLFANYLNSDIYDNIYDFDSYINMLQAQNNNMLKYFIN